MEWDFDELDRVAELLCSDDPAVRAQGRELARTAHQFDRFLLAQELSEAGLASRGGHPRRHPEYLTVRALWMQSLGPVRRGG